MTPEKQRIAIAEHLGWLDIAARPSHTGIPWVSGLNPHPDKIVAVVEHCPINGLRTRRANESDYGYETVPDYVRDLNAMHAAWQTLTHDQHRVFRACLQHRVYHQTQEEWKDNVHRSVSNATAAQRAEAFLQAIGKWEDGE